MSDFSELDLPSLSEDELWAEVRRVEQALGNNDGNDVSLRRTIVGYLKRVNEELGRRRGSRSGNGGA